MLQQWNAPLVTALFAGPAIANTNAIQSLLPDHCQIPIPGGFLQYGSTLRLTGCCQISNIGTTPGTMQLAVSLGGIYVWVSGQMQLSTTAHTNVPLQYEVILTCRSIGKGTDATLIGLGQATSQALSLTATGDSPNTLPTLLMPNTPPAVGLGFDSTISNIFNHQVQFSVANAGNNILLNQFILESMN
jgi:hypothetical protein